MAHGEFPVIRRRVLDGWLRVLTLLEAGIELLEDAHEVPPKEFVETLKIASLEIRVAVKELPEQAAPEAGDAPDTSGSLSIKKLKLVS